MKKILLMIMIIITTTLNTYSQEVYAASHVKFCEFAGTSKETCLEYFTLEKEGILITRSEDSLSLTSNVEFLHNTYYIYKRATSKAYDKDFKSFITKYIAVDTSGDEVEIFLTESPVKHIYNKYILIVRVNSSATIYLLNKL